MRFTKWLWPIIIICSALAALLSMRAVPGLALRPFFIMIFLFICPGMALVRFMHLRELVIKLALAMALSFAIDGLVVGIYLYANHWAPFTMLFTLACLSIALVVIEETHVHRMLYQRVAILRRLGSLLAHPIIIGTSSARPQYADDLDLVEEPTVRIVSVNSISNLLARATPLDIEEKPTVQTASVRPLSSPNWDEDIEEKPTVETASARPTSSPNWDEDIEEKPTVETANARPLSSPNWDEDIEEKPTVETVSARPTSNPNWDEDIEEKPTMAIITPLRAQEDEDIEEKPTMAMATPPLTREDDDKTVVVAKSAVQAEQSATAQTSSEEKTGSDTRPPSKGDEQKGGSGTNNPAYPRKRPPVRATRIQK